MGEVSKALGVGSSIEFRGTTYRLTPLTFEGQAFFEQWLEGRAVEAARRVGKRLGPGKEEEMVSATVRDIAAGVYSFGGRACMEAVKSLPGVKYLVYLALLKEQPDVTQDLVDDLFEAKLAEVMAALSQAEGTDPNALTPGAAPPAAA